MTRFSRREALKVLAGSPALLVSPAVAQDARRNPRPHNASAAPASELDFKRDFGALGDGAFDNSDAFTKFGHAARGCSKAGRAVRLRIAPGQYQYDAKKCFGFLFDIENLHIVAHGAAVQNTYDTAVANSNYEFPWPSIHSYLGGKYVINNEGALIFKATAGDQRIVLKSPAELEEVPVGAYVLIASLNIQYMGYPHNCDRFDYARVTAVDPATGAVTLDRRLKYSHLEDFPELFNRAYCSGPHVGRARIWNMNKYELHDVEHTTDGLTILPILHKNHDYQDIFVSTGRKQVYNDCTFSGYGPTNIEHFAMRNCTVRGRGEVDKLIDLIDIDGCSFESGVNFQSSSVDRVVVKKSTFKDKGNVPSVLAGTAKVLEFDACTIDTLSEGLVLGVNRRLTIKNSIIRNWGFGGNGYSQFGDMSGPLLDLDGVNASYADGVFTIVASSASILRHQCLIYNVVPGAQINLAGPDAGLGPMLTGAAGSGTVTQIAEVDGKLVVTTTLPYARLPEWCPHKFRIQRCGELRITNSKGCPVVETASQAETHGARPFESLHVGLTPANERSGWFMIAGELKRFVVDVRSRNNAGAAMTVQLPRCHDATTYRDAGLLVFKIDLTIPGRRILTQARFEGWTAGDSVTLAGVPQIALPANKWLYQNAFWSFSQDPAQLGAGQRPDVDLHLETDMGPFRTISALL